MDRLVKIVIYYTFGWFLLSMFITIAYLGEMNLTFYSVKVAYYSSGVILLLTSFISFTLMIQLLLHFRQRKALITEILMGVFLMTGVNTLIQGLFSFVRFELSYDGSGDQSSHIFQQFWFNASYYLLCAAFFLFYYFILEVFYDGVAKPINRRNISAIGVYMIGFTIFLLKYTLFGASNLEFILPTAVLLLIGIYIMFSLTKNAWYLRKRLEREEIIERKSLYFIGLTGVLLAVGMIANFIFNILYQAGTEMTLILDVSDLSFLLAYISMYYGFTLPLRNK